MGALVPKRLSIADPEVTRLTNHELILFYLIFVSIAFFGASQGGRKEKEENEDEHPFFPFLHLLAS